MVWSEDQYARAQRTIVLDFDGVICEETKRLGDFASRKPADGILLKLQLLRARFDTIIVHTARVGCEAFWPTVRWLEDYGLSQYIDEVVFNKPMAHYYVDDKGKTTIEEVFDAG